MGTVEDAAAAIKAHQGYLEQQRADLFDQEAAAATQRNRQKMVDYHPPTPEEAAEMDGLDVRLAEGHTTLPRDSQERKDTPLASGVLRYFPAALCAAARVSDYGSKKHHGAGLRHARGLSGDHEDCILRHLMDLPEDYGHGVGYDDNGLPQVAYVVWRALALAQEWLEEHEGAPLAPAAIFLEEDA